MVALPARMQPTVDAIYASYEAKGNKPYITPRIGASKAGADCQRELWYQFHWTTKKRFNGRMLRLFQTGHIEEARMTEDLRAAGVTVIDRDPNTGKQWELTDETGFIVCRMDGAILGLREAPKTWHVGEFKTHNAKSFDALLKDGIEKSKPEHYAQCQLGMHFSGMTRAFYLARCKDTDAIWSDRIKYDPEYCIRLVARLHVTIRAPRPPAKISENPTWFKCKTCDHRGTCHEGMPPPRSCRTCLHSAPVRGETWRCNLWNRELNRDEQREGCSAHLYIPDYIMGEQIDAGENFGGKFVSYRMIDGSVWTDQSVEGDPTLEETEFEEVGGVV